MRRVIGAMALLVLALALHALTDGSGGGTWPSSTETSTDTTILSTTSDSVGTASGTIASDSTIDATQGTQSAGAIPSSDTQTGGANLILDDPINPGHVVFDSDADNLVAGDGNGKRDVFHYSMKTELLTRVSVGINTTTFSFTTGSTVRWIWQACRVGKCNRTAPRRSWDCPATGGS